MTFTQWWTEKRRRSRTKKKLKNNLNHYARGKWKKGSRIGNRKTRHDFRISKSHVALKDSSSEHAKYDRNRIQKIVLDTDSFPIGVDTYSSRCMTNSIYHFETCVPNNRNNKRRMKVADGDSIEVNGWVHVIWKLEDYDGVLDKINIKDTLYVPKLDRCLL